MICLLNNFVKQAQYNFSLLELREGMWSDVISLLDTQDAIALSSIEIFAQSPY